MHTLIVNAHPDPQAQDSATHHMVQHLLRHLPAGNAQVLKLAEAPPPQLDVKMRSVFIKTVFEQVELNPEETALAERMGALVAQLKAASRVVIALPMYNFGIPARLKDWLDNIVVPGETFAYGADGYPQGLMGGRKALVLIASGGVFSEGSYAHMDFATPYLRALLRDFLGFDRVEVVRAEGTQQAPAIGMDKALTQAFAALDACLPDFLAN
ncbi:MAG: NAD(P)H-dependent oxidoreductase [Pseudomonadota bacterium]|nr:NAD(P)H-dependent oxidoreductase [Pseudomonadota bacterium]